MSVPHIDSILAAAAERIVTNPSGDKRRGKLRIRFNRPVAMLLINREGQRWGPLLLRGRDLTVNGMSITSRHMIHRGLKGVVQIRRSNGQMAILAIEVVHCRYIGRMQHLTGVRFVQHLPEHLSLDEFVKKNGEMALLVDGLTDELRLSS